MQNSSAPAPQPEETCKAFLAGLGALSFHSNGQTANRVDYAVFEIKDLAVMFDLAKAVHDALGVKPEFMPEVVPQSYFGRK